MIDESVARTLQDTGAFGAAVQVTERTEILPRRSRVHENRPGRAGHTVNPIKNSPGNLRDRKIYCPYSANTCPLQAAYRIGNGGQ
jgi:hypothetical protein